MIMCRQEGYFNLEDIQVAIFEYNGRLTVLPKSAKRPINPDDMSIVPQKATINTEVIMDGRVLDENLKRLGLDINWLNNELRAQGYKSAKEILLGICDDNHKLTLYES